MPIDDTAPIAPLENLFNAVSTEAANALAAETAVRQIRTFKWANQVEQDAQSDVSDGDVGYRVDTGVLYVRSDSAWVPRYSGPFREAAGSYTTPNTSFHLISFPAGRFTVPPIVTVQINSGSGGAGGATARTTAISATGFSVATSVGVAIQWRATQMTPNSAEG